MSRSQAATYKVLVAKLSEVQQSFNDIWSFVEDFPEDATLNQVTVRLERLDELREKFSEYLIEVKTHDNHDDKANPLTKERQEFSERFYQAKAFLLDQVKLKQEPVDLNQTNATGLGNLDHVKLPQIKLQTFGGNVEEWLSFRDLFSSLIHGKADLPEVEKFYYLKGCLQGESKNLIDSLPITSANYKIAWDLLLKRYDNSKHLKKLQVQALFKLPCLMKESSSDLHTLVDGFERIVQTLDNIVQPADYRDLLLVNMLTTRLDPVTRRGWEEFSSTKQQDTVEELSDYLQRRIRMLESLPAKSAESKSTPQWQQAGKSKATSIKSSYSTTQAVGGRCIVCGASHLLFQCSVFQAMSQFEKEGVLRSHSLCRNCFKLGHHAKECQSKFSCRFCQGRHHSLVCFRHGKDSSSKPSVNTKATKSTASREVRDSTEQATSRASSSVNPNVPDPQVSNMAASDTVVGHGSTRQAKVLLATAVLIVEDNSGHRYPARALLDSGSESNFVTEGLSQRMKVRRSKVDVKISGIGQAVTKVRQQLEATVRSRLTDFSQRMSFLVLPKVTVNLPTSSINIEEWNVPDGIELADPSFNVCMGVDMVLGIESFFHFFRSGRQISLGERLPALNESVFGWVVCGGASVSNQSLNISCNVSASEGLEELVARFWSCEEVGVTENYSPQEARCEEHFVRTVRRGEDGRYTVSLPKDEDVLNQIGYRRMQSSVANTALLWRYLQLGHMTKVEITQIQPKRCYLPHHPVVKEASTTTKVRVVFNASSETSTRVTLNDALLVGPIIQDDLRSIIMRSRTKQVMLVADVEKMFRQVLVCEEDRPLQSILWRSSPEEEISAFQLNTVTYGTKPAPFLATRVLKQLSDDEEGRFPLAAKTVREDTYMDDVITGTNEVDEAVDLRKQLQDLMEAGGFNLRKWASNPMGVLYGVSAADLAIPFTKEICLDPDPSVKTLGLTWIPGTDTLRFQFKVPPLDEAELLTKRKVLSIIATLFDPIGLIGAAITLFKVFMQILWTLKNEEQERLDWDEPLPKTVGEEWRSYHLHLPTLNQINIRRCVIIPKATRIELHCFSDASEKAYGGCVYVRSENSEGKTAVHLFASKSRVAPLKSQTIPRLELCGALLTAELFEKVNQAIKLPVHVHFWTDSTCVLRWIAATPSNWSAFVGNRCAKIQRLTEGCQWRHVPGMQNPADLISRGITPRNIAVNSFWWHGPDWLSKGPVGWPHSTELQFAEEAEREKRRTVTAVTTSSAEEFIEKYITKFSSYGKLIRSTAIWQRFIKLLRIPKDERRSRFMTTVELKEAEETIIRQVQKVTLAAEWKALSKGIPVSQKSQLRWFHPYMSSEGLIRLGGRLGHSAESEDFKHPIVLPKGHRLTRLLIESYHERLLHAGPQLLLSTVRLKFWPLGGRDIARQVVHHCYKCFRAKPSPVKQFMGELPAERVTVARPFSRTGIDYFGPLYVRPGPRRTAIKAYGAIFVCMATKAVHIELVSDLSTDRFIQALRRFVARRGKCAEIFSDNGTNFVGARNRLEELLRLLKDKNHKQGVNNYCLEEGIRWHFSPPSGPHFGGLWEAAVRSTKYHLQRVVGDVPVSIEDMITLLIQVEGCLNSRPLTALSTDPNDLEPLTPAHFLIGASLHSLPELDVSTTPVNRLTQKEVVQRKLQDFWNRWRREYLSQLQGRIKRWRPPVDVKVGKMVVICDNNVPPMHWKLGRIEKTHPGTDGIVRVVTLRTASGSLKRPVEKVCFLPEPFKEHEFYTHH
ncbi:uncharacterized protein LOC134206926 [Armigeres subalbatus]|uniref:uncharacterized protein LOC134206926 n=1 Tax=Armigeres subalbatus TaxID=124917 RepID=UPI002ED4DCE2